MATDERKGPPEAGYKFHLTEADLLRALIDEWANTPLGNRPLALDDFVLGRILAEFFTRPSR